MKPKRVTETYELGHAEIIELVKEAMDARHFLGGQPGTAQKAECHAHILPLTARIDYSIITENSS
jgi:hypothetical protein